MSEPNSSKTPLGGGCLMAGGVMVGAFGGGLIGQSSIGFLLGLGLGALGAVAIWLWQRRG